jgi:uncharacterized protein (TIGR03437 family)
MSVQAGRSAVVGFFLGASLCGAASLWFGPYLQDVRDDRATVMWAARGAGAGRVRYGKAGDEVRTAPSTVSILPRERTGLAETLYLHRAVLEGLEGGARYRYTVLLDGEEVAAPGETSFVTPGGSVSRFLVIGDTGDGQAAQRRLAGRLAAEHAEVLLHTGDIAYWDGTFLQFEERFFGIYASILTRMALFTTPGNHDYGEQDAFPYRTLFAPSTDGVPAEGRQRYYSFDWGNAHFAVVDTNTPLERAVEGTGRMLAWLEHDLRLTRQPLRIVLLHHTPFPASAHKENDLVSALVRQYVTPVVERAAVHLVLAGHEHVYQRTHPRFQGVFSPDGVGTVYVTTGGGGSQHYDPQRQPFAAAAMGGSHALRLETGPASIRLEAFGPDSQVFDRAVISALPVVEGDAVVNAASGLPGVAPGSLLSIYGWNLAMVDDTSSIVPAPLHRGGVSVRVNDQLLPLLFVSRTQINAQLPFTVTPEGPTMQLTVETEVGASHTQLAVRELAPAIFPVRAGDAVVAAALHADGRLVSAAHPAQPGEVLAVFGTGLGPVSGELEAGAPAPASPLLECRLGVRALVGGRDAPVSLACLAPGLVGVYQVNFRVPAGLGAGMHNLHWLVGGAISPGLSLPVGE